MTKLMALEIKDFADGWFEECRSESFEDIIKAAKEYLLDGHAIRISFVYGHNP